MAFPDKNILFNSLDMKVGFTKLSFERSLTIVGGDQKTFAMQIFLRKVVKVQNLLKDWYENSF